MTHTIIREMARREMARAWIGTLAIAFAVAGCPQPPDSTPTSPNPLDNPQVVESAMTAIPDVAPQPTDSPIPDPIPDPTAIPVEPTPPSPLESAEPAP